MAEPHESIAEQHRVSEHGSFPWYERCLRFAEVSTVLGIAGCAAAASVYEIFWIIAGNTQDPHTRFRDALVTLDAHWRLGAALLVPLFYRTIRTFLDELEEAFGLKRKKLAGHASDQETR